MDIKPTALDQTLFRKLNVRPPKDNEPATVGEIQIL